MRSPKQIRFGKNTHMLRKVTLAAITCVVVAACASREDIASLRPFSPSDIPASAEIRPVTSPELVVGHSQGFSSVSVSTQRDTAEQYSTKGRGEPLPVTVFIGMPQGLRGLVRSAHRSVELERTVQFSGLLTDEVNRTSALALAQEALARSYCLGGRVTPNNSAVIFDNSGARPVARRVDVIRVYPFGGRFVPGWAVELQCSRWRKT